MEKEKVGDKKDVILQTEPVFIKSKDCESSTDDLNEYFRVAVSGLTVKQEFKCRDCSENFRIKRHLMTHRRATHKEKVNICRKFAARIHCPFGSERCWYIHKETGTNNSLSEKESECKLCEKVFRALPNLMWHNNKNTMKIERIDIRKQTETASLGQIVVGLAIKKHSALIGRKKKFLNAEHANKYLILNLI